LQKDGGSGPPSTSVVTDLLAVVEDAQKQTNAHRPNENATHRAWLDDAYTNATYDANCGKSSEVAAYETQANKARSSPRRESANNAAELPAEAAGCPEGPKFQYWTAQLMLVSGVDFQIEIAKVRQSAHRQAVLVFFVLDVHFHQMRH
jgi:hypothetical protein